MVLWICDLFRTRYSLPVYVLHEKKLKLAVRANMSHDLRSTGGGLTAHALHKTLLRNGILTHNKRDTCKLLRSTTVQML